MNTLSTTAKPAATAPYRIVKDHGRLGRICAYPVYHRPRLARWQTLGFVDAPRRNEAAALYEWQLGHRLQDPEAQPGADDETLAGGCIDGADHDWIHYGESDDQRRYCSRCGKDCEA